jgi:hypothetical protein
MALCDQDSNEAQQQRLVRLWSQLAFSGRRFPVFLFEFLDEVRHAMFVSERQLQRIHPTDTLEALLPNEDRLSRNSATSSKAALRRSCMRPVLVH